MKLNRGAARWTLVLTVLSAVVLLLAAVWGLSSTDSTQAAPLGQGTGTATRGAVTTGTTTVGAAAAAAGTPTGGTTTPQLAVGRMEYVQMGCANCHGALGEGAIGPQLAGRNLPLGFFLLQVRTPRGVMPPYATSVLSDTEVAAISDYINSLPAPGAAVTATESMTVTMQKLGMGLEALRYLQAPDMQKYLARGDLQAALQQLQQALGAVQQELSLRSTALPPGGTPTPGIQATPKGALPLPLLPTPTSAPPGAPAPTSISASVATPGGAALSTPAAPTSAATSATGASGANATPTP
jgi:mono/diheme cytochrome c family protein